MTTMVRMGLNPARSEPAALHHASSTHTDKPEATGSPTIDSDTPGHLVRTDLPALCSKSYAPRMAALLCTIATGASASVSLLSPYRRPVFLQPVRLAAEFSALQLQRSRSYQIAELGRDVEIKPAGNRGNGLFALRTFEPDEIVVRYSGVYASERDLCDALAAGLTSGAYVAESDFGGGGSRFIE